MAGAGKPVNHMAHHDLESLFCVLLGISILYDEPYQPKSDEELVKCFDIYFNTFQLSLLKTITIQSQLGLWANILKHISPYFQPLIPVFEMLYKRIILPMTVVSHSFNSGNPIAHDYMIKCLLSILSELPDMFWVARDPPNDEGHGDANLRQNSMTTSHITDQHQDSSSQPQSDLELSLMDSSHRHSTSKSNTNSSKQPECMHMHRPESIRKTSGPGFVSSSTSSSGIRRQLSESDVEYVDSSIHFPKRLCFNPG